ncbi:MAG: M56 family metallopeptidase [Lachnospiraceae bacterium]|nr:M56 family metallopeptidase [Lachnospiraceae bacterium]
MSEWLRLAGILDFCAVYFTTQLVRCAVFSFLLIGFAMLLRKTVFSEQSFVKGILWASFLIIPFLGRLKLFYGNETLGRIVKWIDWGIMTCLWVDRIYIAGILTAAICIFGKRLRFRRTAAGMKKMSFGDKQIYVTDMNVTPFTTGLLKPKIVLPRIMLDCYSRDELMTIIQHERTHIRLGHLWCGFVWDILRCLFWINPFLSICRKCFRADMEDICDRVCIQNSGRTAQEYGLMLLKSLKLLRSEREDVLPAATYAGEKEFADIKRRIRKIAGFHPYRKGLCAGMTAAAFMIIGLVLLVIQTHSYARCNENRDIIVYQYDGEVSVVSGDTEVLSRMISYDDSFVYVDREAFEDFLHRNHAEGEIYIIFGGYYKLPGVGGAAEACFYENSREDRIVRIPYASIRDDWVYVLCKLL